MKKRLTKARGILEWGCEAETIRRQTLDWLDDAKACARAGCFDPIVLDPYVAELLNKGASPSMAMSLTQMLRDAQALAQKAEG